MCQTTDLDMLSSKDVSRENSCISWRKRNGIYYTGELGGPGNRGGKVGEEGVEGEGMGRYD